MTEQNFSPHDQVMKEKMSEPASQSPSGHIPKDLRPPARSRLLNSLLPWSQAEDSRHHTREPFENTPALALAGQD